MRSHRGFPIACSGWRQNGDKYGNPFRGLPPDPLHREDSGVWLTLIDAFCELLRQHFPTTRRKRGKGADGEVAEESHSDKIDEINERVAIASVEGRWESFNIPSEYLPDHTCTQARGPSYLLSITRGITRARTYTYAAVTLSRDRATVRIPGVCTGLDSSLVTAVRMYGGRRERGSYPLGFTA